MISGSSRSWKVMLGGVRLDELTQRAGLSVDSSSESLRDRTRERIRLNMDMLDWLFIVVSV